MTPIDPDLTLAQLAALISETLKAERIPAVLSGGSVVSIYSDNQYQSRDLDFVTIVDLKRITPVMNKLGFIRHSGRHYEHPDCPYFVEFPSGPLMIGDEFVQTWAEFPTDKGVIQILSPTQCVMDRLAAFYHWSDRQCLDQALMVARRHPIDLQKIQLWSTQEKQLLKFQEFQSRLVY